MPLRASILAGLLVGLLAAGAHAEGQDAEERPGLQNASFEQAGGGVPGWTLTQGATTDGSGASSKLVIDRTVASAGSASLRVEGRADTSLWNLAEQKLVARAGDRVSLRARAKCIGVKREGHQFGNAHVHLIFVDAAGKRLAFVTSLALSGETDWTTLGVTAIAPPGTTHLRAGLFFSMTGTMWFDGVKVTRAATEPFDRAVREAALRDLFEHLGRTYTFFGYRGKPTLSGLRKKHEASVTAAKARPEFQAALVRMLAELKDMHVWLKTPEGIEPTMREQHPKNWNIQAIRNALTKTYLTENNLLAGEIGSVAYLGLGSFQYGGPIQQAMLHSALDQMKDATAIVIDVRFNMGGNEAIAQGVAARFCAKRVLYAKNARRDGAGFRESGRRFVVPSSRTPYTKPVVVLQGRNCVSSGEGFVAMMRVLDSVTTVGQPTRGSSGNPQPFPLLPGLEVWSSTWRSLTPDGKCHEGVGLPPDVEFDPPPAEFATSDPLLEKALAILGKKTGAPK